VTPDAAAPAVTTHAARGAAVFGTVGRTPYFERISYILTIVLTEMVFLADGRQRQLVLGSIVAGTDAQNYWQAWQGGLYHGTRLVYGLGVYLYSPAFAQLFFPLTTLDWTVVRILWAIPAVIAFAWLVWPAGGPYRIGLGLVAGASVATGNIEWMLCLVLVFGLRAPAVWAVGLLTKVTPGVGLLWFVARREWRPLGVAVVATFAVIGISFAIAPGLWFDWLDLLYRNVTVPNFYEGVVGLLPLRLAAAAVIVWIGARRDRPEALVFAIVLATPDINFTTGALMCALPRIAARARCGVRGRC
jgi:Glycosyltransferase family 87